MKVKVKTRFIDKETKKLLKAGTVIEVSEARYNEIKAAGNYVEEVKATTKASATKKPVNDETTAQDAVDEPVLLQDESGQAEDSGKTTSDILDDVLNGMTVVELKEHAKKHGVDLSGARTKEEIVEAIKATGTDDTVDAQSDSEQALDDMTVVELKEYANEHDIDLNGARTKAAILEAIKTTKK